MLVYNIGQLLSMTGVPRARRGVELGDVGLRRNAYVEVVEGRIARVGPMIECPQIADGDIDAEGGVVLPGFVDCHTHLVHAGGMHGSFADRCAAVERMDARELGRKVKQRVEILRQGGTTTVEIKTGYATTDAAVRKSLYAVPRQRGVVLTEMSPLASAARPSWTLDNEPRFIDALCDAEGFAPEQLRGPLEEMKSRGVRIKLHTGVSGRNGGVALAVENEAISVEHLLFADAVDARMLGRAATIAVLLPAMAYYTGAGRYAPARMLIDEGAAVALGTDANPGDSPTQSMPFVVHLACREMKMSCEEALVAATVNAAHAIGEGERVGSLEVGKDADLLILESDDYRDVPAVMGSSLVRRVVIGGEG